MAIDYLSLGPAARDQIDRQIGKQKRKQSKYRSERITIDGETFDSRREARHWAELRMLERSGEISVLRRQVGFELIPPQKDGSGKLIERSVTYVADFDYKDGEGHHIVEDTKGFRTKEYIIKRKLMLYVYGIRIREV